MKRPSGKRFETLAILSYQFKRIPHQRYRLKRAGVSDGEYLGEADGPLRQKSNLQDGSYIPNSFAKVTSPWIGFACSCSLIAIKLAEGIPFGGITPNCSAGK